MKLEDIKTVEQAESLAYRQVITIEQAQQNLRALQQRIQELSAEKGEKK